LRTLLVFSNSVRHNNIYSLEQVLNPISELLFSWFRINLPCRNQQCSYAAHFAVYVGRLPTMSNFGNQITVYLAEIYCKNKTAITKFMIRIL